MSDTVLSLWRGEIPKRPTYANILHETAERHGLTVDDIKGPRVDHKASRARQEAWRDALALTDLSSVNLGRLTGGRDHSTVLKGIKSLERRMAEAQS